MSAHLRLAFAGTPEFSVPHLGACRRAGIDIVGVYTQPDRRAGRGRSLVAGPVKRAALDAGLAVMQPATLRDAQVRAQLRALDLDLLVVVAYGLILPRAVLAMPRSGCWNLHASLLPRWRGAAPIQRALLAGDRETGVCLMQMEAGLDTGPVLLRRAVPIRPDDTGGTLHDKLAALGSQVLGEGLDRLLRGEPLPARAQAADGVTYAHKLEKAEARLDWNEAADVLARKVRAFDPWPVAETSLGGERVRVWRARALTAGNPATPGQVLHAGRDGVDVACTEGALRLLEIQRPGGRRMAVADYLNARPALGDRVS